MSHIGNIRFQSSEAWSFGTGPKNRTYQNQGIPGPGQYRISNDIREPRSNIPIGKAKRVGLYNPNDAPGPGTYREKTTIGQAPSYSMVPRREGLEQDQIPGPGTYQQENKTLPLNPQYSFGIKTEQHKITSVLDKNIPGPGTYNHKDEVMREGVGSRFGNAKRESQNLQQEIPGPGKYQHKQGTGEGPKYGFGSQQRMERPQSAQINPGPGQYNHKNSIKVDKGYSMTARRPDVQQSQQSEIPGPGTYSARQNPKNVNQPQFSIGNSQRKPLNTTEQIPGPGVYNAQKQGTQANPLSRPTTAPGPGTYRSLSKSIEGPQYSMVPKREQIKGNMKNPGPGTYECKIDPFKQKEPSWGIGTAQRRPLSTTENVPGPGCYENKSNIGGPKWGFGTQTRLGKKSSDVVGPGHYNIPTSVAVVPRYNMQNTARF